MAPKKGSKQQSKQASRAPSGASTPAVRAEPVKLAPAAAGINFGQSFSSVAVINKEGLADCIANDDGERQIASALSFNGIEEYSGVPARVQLVRNAQNTILNFRNLLGKTYDEVKSVKQPYNSAPIVDANGVPAFTVEIDGKPTTLTAHECAVRYLTVLLSYATDFLGRPITHAVLSVPAEFTPAQTKALTAAAEEAKIKVLQTVTESAAALAAYAQTVLDEEDKVPSIDRNSVVLDIGGSSTTVSVVAVRDGLFVPLATVTDSNLGGEAFDAKLMEWFGKEFTKKTKVPLEASNHRALMKLRLQVEVTKKSLSASNSASCSVESLAEGMDFHGSINRMRFDLLSSAIYSKIIAKVEEALEKAKLDVLQIQEVVLVGGTTRIPALTNKLYGFFNEDNTTITARLDSDEVVARGTALQAQSLLSADNLALINRLSTETSVLSPSALSAPIGIVIGEDFHALVEANTPLPTRRIIEFPISSSSGSQLLLSFSEGEESVKVEAPPPKPAKKAGWFGGKKDEDEDEDEEDEEEEVRTLVAKPTKALADLVVDVDSKAAKKGLKVKVTIVVVEGGKGTVTAVQTVEGAKVAQATF
ncbi:Hsp70 protein-domain-containing protein [Leucosporidium creatinivorum]|uniref:Hsp70 protein-domain-containing protein n=1 Tax=Leucosporidium creatinivorum TaxID=106004 RepID=A0A1Y2G5U0_9BASI|nr:Hsp70 protein-domain-containing protein [Leucosporidium creatinivorum]